MCSPAAAVKWGRIKYDLYFLAEEYVAGRKGGSGMTLRRKEALTGFLLTVPFLAGFLLFYIFPFGISVFYSFTEGIGGRTFVGIKNYAEVLQSYAFRLAASNTFRFMGFGIPLIMVISLAISLLLYRAAGHTHIFRSIFLYPMVVPIGSLVMFFQVVFSEYGIVNRVLYQLGMTEVKWLDGGAAFYVLLILYIWKNSGYNMVLFLTGLNGIPREYEESAKLEGAGKWQYFRYIQFPLLLPSFLFVFVMSVINSFKCFREAYLLGGSYPDESIYMLQHFMNNNFQSLNYQRLSVAAFLVFLVIFALVMLLFAGNYRMEREEVRRRPGRTVQVKKRTGKRYHGERMRKTVKEQTDSGRMRGNAARHRKVTVYGHSGESEPQEYRKYQGMLFNEPEHGGMKQRNGRKK